MYFTFASHLILSCIDVKELILNLGKICITQFFEGVDFVLEWFVFWLAEYIYIHIQVIYIHEMHLHVISRTKIHGILVTT